MTITIIKIDDTCIILHNMIMEDEGNDISNWSDDVDPPIRVHRAAQEVQYRIERNSYNCPTRLKNTNRL